MLMAPMMQMAAHLPQPVHRSASCITEVFFHARVSKANNPGAQADMHLPQPEQRVASMRAMRAMRVLIGIAAAIQQA